ncbi:MAG: tRNA pseudouridine(55) synthase TruB [Thermoguttaceae bacterium]
MTLSGILNIDKPSGITSRRAVDMVKRLVRPAKVGHAGTLDPLASGVLIVCIGAATRLIEYVQRMPKSYTGTFLLGRHSATEDVEGEVIELADPPIPSREQIEQAAKSITGNVLQRPPAFSALKVKGQRAYHLARKGKTVELQARPITIHRISVQFYDYPQLTLEVDCGSGTYIRSLGRDLAALLGTSAVMSALKRTAIGRFRLCEARQPADLTSENLAANMLPMLCAVEHMPRVELSTAQIEHIRHGRPISDVSKQAVELAAIDADGKLIAILCPGKNDSLRPTRTFF